MHALIAYWKENWLDIIVVIIINIHLIINLPGIMIASNILDAFNLAFFFMNEKYLVVSMKILVPIVLKTDIF